MAHDLLEAVALALVESARSMKQSIPPWEEAANWQHPGCGLTIREAALQEADAALAVIRTAFAAPSKAAVNAAVHAREETGLTSAAIAAAAAVILGGGE